MELDAIFFIGPQGSGKGTQARNLASRLNFFYWEMGGILREEAAKGTPLGLEIAKTINNGYLVNDEHLYPVIEDFWSKIKPGQAIIFDGLPRRVNQAEWLLARLKKEGRNKFATVWIDVPREESIKRLLDRAHHEFRQDDTRELIEKRLDLYDEHTAPVLDYLKQHSEFLRIQGQGSIEEVRANINQALGLEN
jgi:adenylate kinase